MKRSISLFLLVILPSVISNSPYRQFHALSEKIKKCENVSPARPLSSRGNSLVSNSDDPQDLILCPGDAFGDLTETYVKLEDCYLAMYHRNILIWSSKTSADNFNRHYQCVFSLERDGNLVLYKEDLSNSRGSYQVGQHIWDSQTNFNPVKTELKVHNQQVQIVQTFRDGATRLFYADADHQDFVEDQGKPIEVAEKFIIKSHQDEDKTILRRNEYIGDLNNTYLILQTNCQLQLLNRDKILWSFIPSFRHEMNCILNIAQDHSIEISSPVSSFAQSPCRESIMKSSDSNLVEVLHIQITFEDDHPIIIQTLKNGSDLIFCGIPGLNTGLNLKREPTQVALKNITLQNPREFVYDPEDAILFVMKRMDYIGNLTGLHLILGQDCILRLSNGNKTLWEAASEPFDGPLMDCSVKIYSYGRIELEREFAKRSPSWQRIFGHNYLLGDNPGLITGFELTLENDQIRIELGISSMRSDIFYVGPKTNGTLFQFIAQNSVLIAPYDEEILPKKGYIGDLDGVFTILDKTCNWVLYNRTQIIWESGTSWYAGEYDNCFVYQETNRDLVISTSDWSALKIIDLASSFEGVVRTEMLVENSGLWLIYTFRDGSVEKYQAIPGTKGFEKIVC